MKIFSLIQLALRSINRNRMRSLLTMMGIIIGVASVIALMAIGNGTQSSIKSDMGKLGTNMITISPGKSERGGVRVSVGQSDVFKEKDIESIQSYCPTVKYVTPVVQSKCRAINGSNNSSPTLYGGYLDYLIINNFELEYGQSFDDQTGKSLQKVCVIGSTVAEDLFWDHKEAVGAIIRINKIPFRVIGVLEEKGQSMGMDRDDVIIAPFKTIQRRIIGGTGVSQILAATETENEIEDAKNELNSLLLDRLDKTIGGEPNFSINTQKEMMEMMGSITGVLTMLLAAIASISLLVGGIGIMNIMLVTVTERTREIGLRLAIGAAAKAILLQFLTESVILSLVGGILGISLGIALALLTGYLLEVDVSVSSTSISLAFGFSFMIGVIFGFFPARKAARLNPIQALRFE